MEDELRGKERRRDERRRLRGPVTISWMTPYGRQSCVGNSFDRSAYGLLAEIPQPILTGKKVTVDFTDSEKSMTATVRHCRKHGAWYRIGLQVVAAKPPAPAPVALETTETSENADASETPAPSGELEPAQVS
jgi:hypothetical protein